MNPRCVKGEWKACNQTVWKWF